MILTTQELIKVLRESVNIQYEEAEVIDPAYLVMTDEDILLFVKLGVSRAYPNCVSLSDLPDGADYPVTLLAKIELYTKLAVMKADKVDMGADNNNYLKQDQRFQHYMKLVASAKEQYENWLENEGQGLVESHDVLLDRQHYSNRNYTLQSTPKVRLSIDGVASDSVEFHWSVTKSQHFSRFKVFISDSPIVDMFRDGSSYDKKINEDAVCIVTTHDPRFTHHRVGNLQAEKTYYLAVVSVERNSVFGYAEVSFDTLPELQEEEDNITDNIPTNPPTEEVDPEVNTPTGDNTNEPQTPLEPEVENSTESGGD